MCDWFLKIPIPFNSSHFLHSPPDIPSTINEKEAILDLQDQDLPLTHNPPPPDSPSNPHPSLSTCQD